MSFFSQMLSVLPYQLTQSVFDPVECPHALRVAKHLMAVACVLG